MLLSFAQEMEDVGYKYAAYNSDKLTDSDTLEFFRNPLDAKEYCLVMTNDADYYKSSPIGELIADLKAVLQSGIDTSENEAMELTGFAERERERKEFVENNLKTETMNEKNLEYLKDQLKYTGFGETFETDLREKMLQGDKDFKIIHNGIMNNGLPNRDSLTVELNFKKSDQSDMYFFNSYHVNLQKEDNKPGLEQTFYINKDSNITMKEAYNLMEGRSVNKDLKTKEGELYNAWISMNFKETDSNGNFKLNQYHQNYGYNLEAALEKHSIKELQTPQYKEDLMNSLKKGNVQSVTFVVSGEERKQFVEANPQFKTVKVYDSSMQRINDRESKDQKKSESESQSVNKDLKRGQNTGADSETYSANNKPKKKQGKSI